MVTEALGDGKPRTLKTETRVEDDGSGARHTHSQVALDLGHSIQGISAAGHTCSVDFNGAGIRTCKGTERSDGTSGQTRTHSPWMWWYTPGIAAGGRLRHEGHCKFKASLNYMARCWLRKQNETRKCPRFSARHGDSPRPKLCSKS